MPQVLTLLRLFLQQLIRRKSLWVIVVLGGVQLLINWKVSSMFGSMMDEGVRYDLATHRAAGVLDTWAAQLRYGLLISAVLVGAMIAPASRRDGTTQFVLTLSVSRLQLALAQFGALAVFVVLATGVVHLGYVQAAYRLDVLQVPEALLAWIPFLISLLLLASASFALSLTRSIVVAYGILIAVPQVLLPLLQMLVGNKNTVVPEAIARATMRVLDNIGLFFPSIDELTAWPHVWVSMPERAPFPALGLEVLHSLAATALWIVLGLWAYRRYDLGSRLPTK